MERMLGRPSRVLVMAILAVGAMTNRATAAALEVDCPEKTQCLDACPGTPNAVCEALEPPIRGGTCEYDDGEYSCGIEGSCTENQEEGRRFTCTFRFIEGGTGEG